MQNGVWDTGRLRCRKHDVVAKAISGKVEEKNLLSLNGLEASWLNTKIHSGIYGEINRFWEGKCNKRRTVLNMCHSVHMLTKKRKPFDVSTKKWKEILISVVILSSVKTSDSNFRLWLRKSISDCLLTDSQSPLLNLFYRRWLPGVSLNVKNRMTLHCLLLTGRYFGLTRGLLRWRWTMVTMIVLYSFNLLHPLVQDDMVISTGGSVCDMFGNHKIQLRLVVAILPHIWKIRGILLSIENFLGYLRIIIIIIIIYL